MHDRAPLTDSKAFHLLVGLLATALWSWFAYCHIQAYFTSGHWTYLLLCGAESLTAVLFLSRSTPTAVSTDPFDWIFGIAGTFSPFLFSPATEAVLPAARALVVAGVVLQVCGFLSLNRSLAVVAAKRVIKTRGMYHFVRHPLYCSHLVIGMGYVLTNSTLWNLGIFLLTFGLLVARLLREEQFLARDPAYRSYMARVPYRILPLIY